MTHSNTLSLWLIAAAAVLLVNGCAYNEYRRDRLATEAAPLNLVRQAQQRYALADGHMRHRHYGPAISAYASGLLFLIQYREECRTTRCSARQIQAMNKLFAIGYQELARAEYLVGRYASSLNDFRKALKYDQYNAKTHYYLALIFAHQRQHDLVYQEYDILTRVDPKLAKRIEKYLQYH